MRTREAARRGSYERRGGGRAFGRPRRRNSAPKHQQASDALSAQGRKEEIEGFVMIKVLISANGSVTEFEIMGARPEDVFEEVVIDSLPRWRFSPAKDKAGRPMEFWKD